METRRAMTIEEAIAQLAPKDLCINNLWNDSAGHFHCNLRSTGPINNASFYTPWGKAPTMAEAIMSALAGAKPVTLPSPVTEDIFG